MINPLSSRLEVCATKNLPSVPDNCSGFGQDGVDPLRDKLAALQLKDQMADSLGLCIS
jgi:hypothetical protein